MAKKKQRAKKSVPTAPPRGFDIEQSPWFTPAAFVLIFIALVILFRQFIFSDKMLYGSDTIQAGIFFRSYLVDYFHQHGAIPRWNPYIFGGLPYIEAFHGDIFYPLSFLKFFGSIFRMIGFTLFFHIFLAGIFMYLAARQFKLSKIASLLAGVCYMFAPYLVSFVSPGHDGKIYVTTLFPLVMLFLDRGFERRPFFNFSMLGLVIGVIILSPHPQMSYFTLWAVALYAAFRLVMLYVERRKIGPLIRPAVLTTYAVIIGLLLSAIQFYPGYIYTNKFSPRADTKTGWAWATSWSLHQEEAMGLIIPEFPGAKTEKTKTYYWGKNAFKDNSEAVGAVAFFLALLGAFFARRKKGYFFAGLAIFALVYALGATTPVFRLFYYLIPKVKALRAPSMIMFLFSFSAALLAGMGVQRLRDARAKKREAPGKRFDQLLLGFPLFLLALALLFSAAGKGMINLWTSIFYSGAATQMVQKGISKLTVAYANLPAIQSGAWFAFLFVALAAACLWLYRNGRVSAAILVVLLFAPLIDDVRFDNRFVSTFNQKQWDENPVSQYFKQNEDDYRVRDLNVLQPDLLPYFGVQEVVGYHGNQLRWYDDLLGGPQLQNANNPRLLNLTGTKYVLFPGGKNFPVGYLGDKPVTVAANFGQIQILQNENTLPRVFLADQYKVFKDRKAIVPQVVHGTDNLRRIVYLEEKPDIDIPIDSMDQDSAWIVDYQPDTVVIGMSVAKNKLLVLTDNWYDGWHVLLDGHPAKVMRAYGSFRAVAIPAGTKAAMFYFQSGRYRLGKRVTLLTSLYLLVVIGVEVFLRRRRRSIEDTPG